MADLCDTRNSPLTEPLDIARLQRQIEADIVYETLNGVSLMAEIKPREVLALLTVARSARTLMGGGFKSKTEWRNARRDLRDALEAIRG